MDIAHRILLDLSAAILRRVNHLHERLDRFMTTEKQLADDLSVIKTDLDTLQTNVASIGQAQQTTIDAQKAQIADLTAKLAAGSPVSQEDLDALVATADAIKSQADGLVTLVTPAAPPVEPAAEPEPTPGS